MGNRSSREGAVNVSHARQIEADRIGLNRDGEAVGQVLDVNVAAEDTIGDPMGLVIVLRGVR